mmetsp:Transcript_15416/g.22376  ORF Transcript_15416/g.22376 Transcript_15416/m.22376 type:complete len:246 (-) Transcript_15416:29-766(-)
MEPEPESFTSNSYQEPLVPQERVFNPQSNSSDYPSPPQFQTRIERSGSTQINIHHFLIPRSHYYSVVASTPNTMERVTQFQRIPVPHTPFRYSLENFYATFLEELISQSDLDAFLHQVSTEVTREAGRPPEPPNDPDTPNCSQVSRIGILTIVLGFSIYLGTTIGPAFYALTAICLLSIVTLCCYLCNDNTPDRGVDTKRAFATTAEQKLTTVIRGMKHQLLARGILVRPGNYGAFVQFIPSHPI